jgi:hypothetical protein
MIIEENDFRLTLTNGYLWDLELLQTVRPKDKPERSEFQLEGYGIPLENCIKRIINYRLENKKDCYTLQSYFQEYKKELDIINNLVKNHYESEDKEK